MISVFVLHQAGLSGGEECGREEDGDNKKEA